MAPRFGRDYNKLSPDARARAHEAARHLAEDLNLRRPFRPGLRVKRVRTAPPGVHEMTWAPDGRATFEFGLEVRPGEPHVIWRRIGTHSIFSNA